MQFLFRILNRRTRKIPAFACVQTHQKKFTPVFILTHEKYQLSRVSRHIRRSSHPSLLLPTKNTRFRVCPDKSEGGHTPLYSYPPYPRPRPFLPSSLPPPPRNIESYSQLREAAKQIIARVAGRLSGTVGRSGLMDPAVTGLERAAVVANTPITFRSRELLGVSKTRCCWAC